MQRSNRRRPRLITGVTVAYMLGVVLTGVIPVIADDPLPRVPDGFTVEKVADSPLVQHPMMGGFDDRGRLFIAASAGLNLPAKELEKDPPNFIRMLEDTDGDGRFDTSTIFADRMTLPMGALWHQGALYVASPPSIWKLEDTDDDGVADRREELVNSFGFSGNAASIHGCFLGPTGRLFWCDGRHGHDLRDASGNVVSQGQAARIFSCRRDGSDVQSFCGGGMDNPVEVDFTPEGEMLGTVNILLSGPRVDCLMHWIEGGVYPRHDQEQMIEEFKRTGDLLPPTSELGYVAASGLTRYRSQTFGPDYRDNLFLAIFNTHRVVRSVLTRSGATFQTREEVFLVSDDPDFHPTDVLEDADGSLLVIDTGGWFRIGCPTSQIAKPEIHGGIYRIRRSDAAVVEDPRGLALDLDNRNPERLAELLGNRRPAVQQRAIDRLEQLHDAAVPALAEQLTNRKHDTQRVEARRNAVWALSRIGSEAACAALRTALADENQSVRMAAIHSLSECRDVRSIDTLAAMLSDESFAIRRQAATTLGRICDFGRRDVSPGQQSTVIRGLFEAVRTSSTDRILEHALIYALIRIADREQTLEYLQHASPIVRRAALIALDQMDDGLLTRELVVPQLDTDDPQLQKQALEIIGRHEGWARETLSLLNQWVSEPALDPARGSMLRGLLLSQCGDVEIQQLTAEAALNPHTSGEVRLLLLEVMHRAMLEKLPETWIAAVGRALDEGEPEHRLQAMRIIQDRGLDEFDSRLAKLARDDSLADRLRVQALLAVRPRMRSLDQGLFLFLLERMAAESSPLDRLAAARALADGPLDDSQLLELADHLDGAGPLLLPVLLRPYAEDDSEQMGMTLVTKLQNSPSAAGLSEGDVAGLLKSYPANVHEAAGDWLKRLETDVASRRARLDELASLFAHGNPRNGKDVFFGKKAACAGCHRVAGKGGTAGPDLTTIGKIRTARDLVEAIAFPSASFARGFRPYSIMTAQGRLLSGVIGRETATTISLRTADLAEIQIPRDEIEEIKESSTSIMPQGIDRNLSNEELSDLLAYLRELQ